EVDPLDLDMLDLMQVAAETRLDVRVPGQELQYRPGVGMDVPFFDGDVSRARRARVRDGQRRDDRDVGPDQDRRGRRHGGQLPPEPVELLEVEVGRVRAVTLRAGGLHAIERDEVPAGPAEAVVA